VSQKVTFIGPSWRVTRSLGDPNGSPSSIAVSPDGKFALVGIAGYQANELVIFGDADSPDPKITGRISLGAFSYPEATAAAITPNDEYAYVPGAGVIDNGSYTVAVIGGVNTDDPKLSDSLMLNPATSIDASIPCGIAISPNGKYAYATDYSFGTLTVITGAQDGHPELAKPVKAGDNACQIWASPDGKYLYKRNPAGSKITVIGDADSTTPKILDTVSAGSEPATIAVTPDGKYLYAPSGESDKVAILGDAQSAHPKVVATVTTGDDSEQVVTSADGKVRLHRRRRLREDHRHR
jgi:DNA-binding beta-propeller fold protein YncE